MSVLIERPAAERNPLGGALVLAALVHLFVVFGVAFEPPPAEPRERPVLDLNWISDPFASPASRIPDPALATEPVAESTPVPPPTEPTAESAPTPPATEPVAEPAPPPPPTASVSRPAPRAPSPTREATALTPEPPPPAAPRPTPAAAPSPPRDAPRPSAAELFERGLERARMAPTPEASAAFRSARTHYLDTLAARSAPEAAYLEAWIRKVERIGNLNYPEEARRRGLSGTLVLTARLAADGRVLTVDVTQSSGEPILDAAAIRTVELASPFAPFTEDMLSRYDELVITRTWAFRRDRVERVR
jgi:periplasmic protein TonB